MVRQKKIYNASHRREKIKQPWNVSRLNRVAVVTVVALLAGVSGIGALTAQPVHQPPAVDTSAANYPPPYTGVTVLRPTPVLPEPAPEPEVVPPGLQLVALQETEDIAQLKDTVRQLTSEIGGTKVSLSDALSKIEDLQYEIGDLKVQVSALKDLLSDQASEHADQISDLNILITSLVDRIVYLETVVADLLEPEPEPEPIVTS